MISALNPFCFQLTGSGSLLRSPSESWPALAQYLVAGDLADLVPATGGLAFGLGVGVFGCQSIAGDALDNGSINIVVDDGLLPLHVFLVDLLVQLAGG